MSTTVEITDADEFRIVGDALAAFRKERLDRQIHRGIHSGRLNVDCESTTREAAFASHWRRENNSQCGGQPTLAQLLGRVPTDKEVEVVATVIQWFGSNVGFDFICQSLADCGYRVSKLINPEVDSKK